MTMDGISYSALAKAAAALYQVAAPGDKDARDGLRELARLLEHGARIWTHESTFKDPTKEIADLLHSLAAGFTVLPPATEDAE